MAGYTWDGHIEIHVVLHVDAPVRRTVAVLAARLESVSGRPVRVWVDDYLTFTPAVD